ncbi:MAG: MATE family efflux transporter [Oscillospiraceae bacterium]|nr:MATE family efflux transporter [Oscillospiraceae bacterium]
MKIQLSEHFTYPKLLRFVFPSVVMMIFTSIYGVVDGLFISNFVGKTAFAAVNLIYPYLMLLGCLGFVVGTGGSALVSKTMGEGDSRRANQYFSMLVWVTAIAGIAVSAAGFLTLRPVSILLGAQGDMVDQCVLYGGIIMSAQTAFILQNAFQSFFVTAERPQLGLAVSVAAGVTNIVLDALLVGVFRWGLAGAAAATALSEVVGGVVPLIYFLCPNSTRLRLTKARVDVRALWRVLTNGSSELMTNVSMSLVNMLYNLQLVRLAGEDGIAAYGVIMYVNFVFAAIFLGYAVGSAPIISYHYGAEHHGELKNLLGKSLRLVAAAGTAMLVIAYTAAPALSGVFVGYDQGLREMTRRAIQLYAVSYLLAGFNIFASSFFTALNDGPVSAALAFLRTLVFQTSAVLLLPLVLELDGVWLAITVAEALALAVSVGFLVGKRKIYHYA